MAWDDLKSLNEGQGEYSMGNASIILILGIVVFIIPYFQGVFGFKLGFFEGFFTWGGLIFIVVGALISGMKMMNR